MSLLMYTVVHLAVPMLYAPNHSDCAKLNFLLSKKSFWLTVRSRINKTNEFFKVALPLFLIFRIKEKHFEIIATNFNFICIGTVKSFQSSRLFRTVLPNKHHWNTLVDMKTKTTCENGGTQTTRNIFVRHKEICSAGTLYCTQFPNFSTTSLDDLKYPTAEKHSAPKSVVIFKCILCYREFHGFYALWHLKNTQHDFLTKTTNVDPEKSINQVDDTIIKEELRSG